MTQHVVCDDADGVEVAGAEGLLLVRLAAQHLIRLALEQGLGIGEDCQEIGILEAAHRVDLRPSGFFR